MDEVEVKNTRQPTWLQLIIIYVVGVIIGSAAIWWLFEVWGIAFVLVLLRLGIVFLSRNTPRDSIRMQNLAALLTGLIFAFLAKVVLTGGL